MTEPTKTELAEEITLDEALEAAREAIDKFLNNKFEEAYEIVEPKVNNLFILFRCNLTCGTYLLDTYHLRIF